MPLSHRHIDVFRALMSSGSVTGAAQLLFTSQPTVSRELARMESLLGFALFDRIRGRLQATAQAMVLYDEVQRSHIGLERIRHTAQQLRQFAQGQISVLCLPAFAQSLLPGACARLIQQHPDITLSITPQESPFLEHMLASQTHDLGLTEHTQAPPGTQHTPLFEADEVCVLPAHHPLAQKKILQLQDLDGQPFISLALNDPYRQQLDMLLTQHDVRPLRRIDTPSAASVCAMVRNNLGLAIVNPLTALEHQSPDLVMRPLASSIPFRVGLIRPLHRPSNMLVHALESALHSQAKHCRTQLRRALSSKGYLAE